jgi:hypothetical protein
MKKIYTLAKFFLLIPALVLFSAKSHAQVYMYLLDTNYNPITDVPADGTPFQVVMEGIDPSIDLTKVNAFMQDPDSSGVEFTVGAPAQLYPAPDNSSTGTVVYPRISVEFNAPGQPRTQSITFKITLRSKVPPFPSSTKLVYAQTFTTSVILPIVLQSFTATPQGTSAILRWTTASELNNKLFTLQRSDNPKFFKSIANLNGAGTSSVPRDYQYTDNDLTDGLYFYRLLQQDFDGKITVSRVVEVSINGHYRGSVQVFPNPFTSVINMKGISPADMVPEFVKVTDISGHNMPFQIMNSTSIVLQNNVPTGEYFITVKGKTYKVIKQ